MNHAITLITLYIKFKLYHISILHDISFSFGTKFAGGSHGLFGAKGFEVVVVANRGGDETAFEVGMNGAGGFRGSGAFSDGPSAAFFLAGSEEGLEA